MRRRADDGLERPVPTLPLQRRAGRDARRRPDAHHARPERRVQEGAWIVARPEHEERGRRKEERPEDAEQPVERRAGQHLQLEDPSDRDEAESLHEPVTRLT